MQPCKTLGLEPLCGCVSVGKQERAKWQIACVSACTCLLCVDNTCHSNSHFSFVVSRKTPFLLVHFPEVLFRKNMVSSAGLTTTGAIGSINVWHGFSSTNDTNSQPWHTLTQPRSLSLWVIFTFGFWLRGWVDGWIRERGTLSWISTNIHMFLTVAASNADILYRSMQKI